MRRTRLPDDAVVVHLQGGLGNQMFQYASVGAAAARSGRPLMLDLRSLRTGLRSYGLDVFDIDAHVLKDGEASALPDPASRFFWRRRRVGVTRVIERQPDYGAQLDDMPRPAWVLGYWQSPYYFEDWSDHLRQVFSADQVELSEGAMRHLQLIRETETAVAVHVRRGDYVQPDVQAVHGLLGLDYFVRGLELAAAGDAVTPVVFSDDIEWAKRNLPWEHAVFVDPVAGREHEDVLLMAACSRHVISNSSFSWWGAWLAGGERVIAPRRWGVNGRVPTRTLVPDTWQRI